MTPYWMLRSKAELEAISNPLLKKNWLPAKLAAIQLQEQVDSYRCFAWVCTFCAISFSLLTLITFLEE